MVPGNKTPEQQARDRIDARLAQAGWIIQDMKELNPGAGLGVAVREYPTDTGPADYVLLERIRNERAAAGTIRKPRGRKAKVSQ